MRSVTPASHTLLSTLVTLPFLDLLPPVSQSPWDMALLPMPLGLQFPLPVHLWLLQSSSTPGSPLDCSEEPTSLCLDSRHFSFSLPFPEQRERWCFPLPETSCLPQTFLLPPRVSQRCSVFLFFLLPTQSQPPENDLKTPLLPSKMTWDGTILKVKRQQVLGSWDLDA